MPIYSNFQINGALGETRKPPDPLFLKQNRGPGGFRVPPKAPFIWKLLQISIFRATDHYKIVPNLELGGQALTMPTPPVVWVIF